MKKERIIVVLIIVTLICVCAQPISAAADSTSSKYFYEPYHKGYNLQTIVNSEQKPTGLRFSGFYFGDIKVSFDIYSSESFVLDFCINDSLYSYSDVQLKQRTKLLDTAETIHNFIVQVDSVANTQYNGTNDLPKSDIYRYNRELTYGNTLQIDRMTYEMLLVAKKMYNDTDGAFNPAVYRLVDLWGFSSRIYSNGNFGEKYDRVVSSSEFFNNGYPLPDQKYVDAFSDAAFTDFSDNAVVLTRDGGGYYVTKNVRPVSVENESYEQWLDLGGIAKGYVADGIEEILKKLNIDRFYVDAGSSSMAFGLDYNGSDNVLTIPDPFDSKAILGLGAMMSTKFGAASVSTSGQYLRKYTTGGVEYAHIIDGKTGVPAQTGIKLVTIIAPESSGWAGKGDCLTTALTVMGRDGIIEFMNGYLKDNGIDVIVVYQAEDGAKQILSNVDKEEFTKVSDNFDKFSWAIQNENGVFKYDYNAKLSDFTWILITLGVLTALGVGAVVVYYFVKGRKTAVENVRSARRDKPFKLGDIFIYAACILVIIVLFSVFFAGNGEEKVTVVKVIDMETQETVFLYNADRNEYVISQTNGWKVNVERDGDIKVTLEKVFGNETRFNEMTVSFGKSVSVKMTDSICGFHQDCVKNFPTVTKAGGTIVCSPNRLKIVTE